PTRTSTSRSRSGSRCSASTATTCSSCSRPPTWRCTGPRTPAAIRCGFTPAPPGTPKKTRTRQRTRARRLGSMPEFIYQMRAVRKAHGDKVILDNVTLAFLPGAKIGVVGPNGTGKSTLLRMMAGVEQPSNGDARLLPGFTVGLLAQEPELDDSKTVLGNVEDGVAETKKLIADYNAIAEKMATDYSDDLLAEMGRLQEQLDHRGGWDVDSGVEQAMDALRCPPPDADVRVL